MRHVDLTPANDPAPPADAPDLVGAHLAARRLDRRVMIAVTVLAAAVLSLTVVSGYYALQTPPDLTTFAFRV